MEQVSGERVEEERGEEGEEETRLAVELCGMLQGMLVSWSDGESDEGEGSASLVSLVGGYLGC